MNAYLLDTHILLWTWHEPERLPAKMTRVLASRSSFHVSIVTLWEIAIKVSLGKLQTVDNPYAALQETGVELLPLKPSHVAIVATLPLHHRDPFDRMLIAQAQAESLTMLTSDRRFRSYDVALG